MKYTSFTLRLKRWNFKRTLKYDIDAYYNKNVFRDEPDLLRTMVIGMDVDNKNKMKDPVGDKGWNGHRN